MTPSLDRVLSVLEGDFAALHLPSLQKLARIPSVSFDGFSPEEVRRSAAAVADLCRESGLEHVEILDLPGTKAHPAVYADWCHAPGKPTLLLYAHHDVQPPGRTELWKTPPFEPTVAPGPGGDRLWGRGTADDKAGAIVHLAAIRSWLKAQGSLPVNVKLFIEGEEEVGSTHLAQFLSTFRRKLDADVIVLTDTSNFDCGVPALTVALRGMVAVDVEVRALSKSVHSGMWGGPIPDPVMGLSKLLAKLVDEQGRIALPGVRGAVPPLTAAEELEFKAIPFDEKSFREASGLRPGVKILREGPSPIAQLWRFPSMTVTAVQASSRASASNIINDAAWARVTIRLSKGLDPVAVQRELTEFLQSQAPWGLEVSVKGDWGSGPWSVEAEGPAYDAALRALEKGYSARPIKMGCGGSIPFVQPFAEALGGAPALLIGVEDPYTNAHGENESLLISDLLKACRSQVVLFDELSRVDATSLRKN